jgi:arginyl-tRNA--protein-N-Asp/Glu arginylyltransferase
MEPREEFRTREALTQALRSALARRALTPGEPAPCPYLPGRQSRHVALCAARLPPGVYQCLLDLNFRRVGNIFYRPSCAACHECRMIRVTAGEVAPSRSQRRCWARNRDVEISIGRPLATPEKLALFQRYLSARHDGQMTGSVEEFSSLYDSPITTLELAFRTGGRLLGAALADLEPQALSAVYSYFEPLEGRRGLGVLSILTMLDTCRTRGLEHLYLGFHVAGCPKMSYKASFRPHAILSEDGTWSPCAPAPVRSRGGA